MSALRLCAVVSILAFAVTTAVAHKADHTHDHASYYVGKAPRKCTADGDRCAGAEHKPFVRYAPCCGKSKACMADEKRSWGRFCVDAPKSYSKKCYKTGMRCMGEKNKAYVKYMPCCSKKDECVKATDDWGSFCVPVKKDTKEYESDSKTKDYKEKSDEYDVKEKSYASDSYEKEYKGSDYKEHYKSDYEAKYDSYYKKSGSDKKADDPSYGSDYGYGAYGGGGVGKAKKFEEKFNLFPEQFAVPGPGEPTTPNVNTALISLLGLPASFGCSTAAASSPAAADVVPPNPDPVNLGEIFLEGPIRVCNVPGSGLSLAGLRTLLDATCARLRVIDPNVGCWVEVIRGAPISRMASMENDTKAVERQFGIGAVQFRVITVRLIFRGGRAFLQAFVQVLTVFFVQFAGVVIGIVGATITDPSPLALA